MMWSSSGQSRGHVAPLAGARIEIDEFLALDAGLDVAPLAGARIEIHHGVVRPDVEPGVAPLAGARIEISDPLLKIIANPVAPLAGARIEIGSSSPCAWCARRPSRRGEN